MKKLPNKVFFYDGITITDFANFKGFANETSRVRWYSTPSGLNK